MPAENAPHAHADEHVAELRNGGVREDLLDIVLRQADGGGEECGGDADDGDRRSMRPAHARKICQERAHM